MEEMRGHDHAVWEPNRNETVMTDITFLHRKKSLWG